jgi:hypothetical protein
MTTAAFIVVGACWLLCLLFLVLDLAGRPWGRTSRPRSAGGFVACTGTLMLVTHFAFWLGLLLVLAGFACVQITSGRAAKTKTLQ